MLRTIFVFSLVFLRGFLGEVSGVSSFLGAYFLKAKSANFAPTTHKKHNAKNPKVHKNPSVNDKIKLIINLLKANYHKVKNFC